MALAVALGSASLAQAQASGAGQSPTPSTQPSAALPAQPEGSPGHETQGLSGSGPNVTGPGGGAQGNANTGVQEVVVTARRVSENLQNVPLSVTALGARALDNAQVRQVNDLKGIVPNVSIQKTAVAGGAVVEIRGIENQALPNIELDTRVGVYLDGVYIARSSGQSFDLADIQQVEVVKGPQGTLFGRNVTGGAINFLTAAPTGKWGGDLEAGFGDYDRQRYRLTLNLPEVHDLSVRFTYVHDQRDGDVTNTAAGRQYAPFQVSSSSTTIPAESAVSTLGAHDNQSTFLAMRYKGVPHLTVDYKFDYSEDYETQEESQLTGFAGTQVGCVGASLYLGIAVNCGGTFTSLGLPVTSAAANNVPLSASKLSSRALDFEGVSLVRTFGHNLTLQYALTPDVTLKSISSYRGLVVHSQADLDGGDYYAVNNTFNVFSGALAQTPGTLPANGVTPYCVDCSINRSEQHQFSQEFQLLGSYNHVLDYVGGLYYFREAAQQKEAAVVNAAPLFTYGVSSALAGVAVPPQGLAPLTSAGVNVVPDAAFADGDDTSITSQSAAAYGHLTLHAGDHIDLSGGVRYTADHKAEQVAPEIAASTTDPATGENVPSFRSVSFGRVTYDGTATYKVDRNLNVYGRYATAYLSGGLYRNIEFKPEDTNAYEFGFKSQLFDRHLQANAAYFHQSSTNLQDNQISPTGVLFVQNIGSLVTEGFEAQVTYVPIRGLTFNGSTGYTDQAYSDNRPNMAPRLTGQVSAQYDTPRFGNDMYVSLQADGNYRSNYHPLPYSLSSGANATAAIPSQIYASYGSESAYLDALNKAAYDGGYWIANARVSLLDIPFHGTKARLSGFVTNMFNEKGPVYTFNYGPLISTIFEFDRTYGVDLAISF